jgi:dipeptidyl aminopeptidase/acylaminoacyl peptidase
LGSQPNRTELATRLSPLTYVRKGLPLIVTIQGDADRAVPYSQGVQLHNALDAAGVPNELVTIPGGGHGKWTRQENLRTQAAVIDFPEAQGILSREKP